MFVGELIIALRELDGPSRKLDGEVARLIGWNKKMERRGKGDGNVIEIGVWYRPDGSEARKVPFFTESVQSAYELLREIEPNMVAACAFSSDGGKAHIEGMSPVFASTLPIALCISGLLIIEKQLEPTSSLDR